MFHSLFVSLLITFVYCIYPIFFWLYWCLIINAALPIIWRVKFRISRTNCLFIITDKLFCLVEDQHQRLRVIFQGCVIIDHYWLYCSYIVTYYCHFLKGNCYKFLTLHVNFIIIEIIMSLFSMYRFFIWLYCSVMGVLNDNKRI